MTDPSILIVDDDNMYRSIFTGKFREEKFRVLEARDGEEAWELLQNETPDVLFTGILMPKLDGFSLIERLRSDTRYARMKIFILSHHGREEDKVRSAVLHADGFFTMGYIPVSEVVLRVRAALNAAPVFRLLLDPQRLDDKARQTITQIGSALGCEECGRPYVMTFTPDALRPSGFVSVHIECPDCRTPLS